MDDELKLGVLAVLIWLMGVTFCFGVLNHSWRKWSIDVGAAYYHPKTGEWTAGQPPTSPLSASPQCDREDNDE